MRSPLEARRAATSSSGCPSVTRTTWSIPDAFTFRKARCIAVPPSTSGMRSLVDSSSHDVENLNRRQSVKLSATSFNCLNGFPCIEPELSRSRHEVSGNLLPPPYFERRAVRRRESSDLRENDSARVVLVVILNIL